MGVKRFLGNLNTRVARDLPFFVVFWKSEIFRCFALETYDLFQAEWDQSIDIGGFLKNIQFHDFAKQPVDSQPRLNNSSTILDTVQTISRVNVMPSRFGSWILRGSKASLPPPNNIS